MSYYKMIADGQAITLSSSVVTLKSLLSGADFANGCTRVGIQPIGTATVYFGYGKTAAPTSGNMPQITGLQNFENQNEDLDYLYVYGTGKAYVWQEGQ